MNEISDKMNEISAKLVLARCGDDKKKIEAELERHREVRAFYEEMIRFLKGTVEPLEEACAALIETNVIIDELLARLRS